MAMYDSVLLRQNLDDVGNMPRTGGWTASPDIITAGTSPTQNPMTVYTTSDSYKQNITQDIVLKSPNYIYIRGKNISKTSQNAQASLYWAPQSLFLYPSEWENNVIKTARAASTSDMGSIATNQISVTTDPLVWTPENQNEHCCLIGLISTDAYPLKSQLPPNAVTSMNDLASWIGKTGGAGWQNVQFTSAGSPTFTHSTVYNASTTDAVVQFSISCISCPVGSQVSFSCGTPLPNGTYINLPKTTVSSTKQIGFYVKYTVPAGWTSPITYSYYDNGLPPVDNNFSISMSATILVSTPGSEVFSRYALSLNKVFPNHFAINDNGEIMKDMPVNYGIPVGSDMTKLK
jgi:hypothetical protein